MVKKKLCKKCRIKRAKERESPKFNKWVSDGVIRTFERRWKEGRIICPGNYVEDGERAYRKITGNPPIKCPYFLEQIL